MPPKSNFMTSLRASRERAKRSHASQSLPSTGPSLPADAPVPDESGSNKSVTTRDTDGETDETLSDWADFENEKPWPCDPCIDSAIADESSGACKVVQGKTACARCIKHGREDACRVPPQTLVPYAKRFLRRRRILHCLYPLAWRVEKGIRERFALTFNLGREGVANQWYRATLIELCASWAQIYDDMVPLEILEESEDSSSWEDIPSDENE
ncbi:hypothetical protein VTJ49DRAFT_6762 [Mycothermus thermophilus]|uniref:Uncharacterized protein n=1 Tax=Humicola insolens TaxID=85995 RepID=A0ABR3VIS7_HUMIN